MTVLGMLLWGDVVGGSGGRSIPRGFTPVWEGWKAAVEQQDAKKVRGQAERRRNACMGQQEAAFRGCGDEEGLRAQPDNRDEQDTGLICACISMALIASRVQ